MRSCFRDPRDPRGRSKAGRHDRVVVVMVELLSTCWCNPPHRSPNLSTITVAQWDGDDGDGDGDSDGDGDGDGDDLDGNCDGDGDSDGDGLTVFE